MKVIASITLAEAGIQVSSQELDSCFRGNDQGGVIFDGTFKGGVNMNTGFRSQVVPEYRLLTENQIREFHRAALEVNEKIGARINNEEGVELLNQHGCTVAEGNMVLIPNYMVEECLQSAPSRIDVYNRKGEEAMRLEGRNIYFGLGTELMNSYDVYTGELRPSLLKDVANASRVADYCKHIDFVASCAMPHDVPTNIASCRASRRCS